MRDRVAVRGLVPYRPRGPGRGPVPPRLPGRVAAGHAAERAELVDHFGSEQIKALGYQAWWNLPALPKLNTDNPKVREYLMRVAEHWIRFGADGWRLDVAAEIDDDDFWREFRRRVKAVNPDAYIVAEVWTEDHRWLQGDQFDAYMNYPLGFAALSFAAAHHRDEVVIGQHGDVRNGVRREDGPGFADRLLHALTTYAPEVNAVQLNLLGSHDMPRILSICAGDRNAVRLATLVQMTVGGAPCIYYGDEIGMTGAHDPYLPRVVPHRRGRLGSRPARLRPGSHGAPPRVPGAPPGRLRHRRRRRHDRGLRPRRRGRDVRGVPQRG